jgi:hypothetical protein
MVLLFASVAGAVPSDVCDKNPDHPQCATTTTTEPTTTTTEPALPACPTGTWTISGKAQTGFECLWIPTNDGSSIARVAITNIQGAIPGPPTVFVRDDSPGDICLLTQNKTDWDEPNNGPDYVASFDLFYDEVPVPSPGDPDVLDYSDWLVQSYWDFVWQEGMEVGTHWCAPQDPVLWSIREDNNGGALIVTVSFNAKKGGSLDITLFPENSL